MRWEALYVSGVGACLPNRTSAEEAVQQGRYSAEDHADNEIAAVAVSESQAAPVMAADAARQALAMCGHGPADIAIVLHASAYYQGQDLWTPASYVQREALGGAAAAIAVDGASNGALAGLELAGAYLSAGSGRTAALISTADRYCAPGFDRWGSDSGVVFGDGASAVVLSQVDGFARVLTSNITGGPELEEAARVTSGFAHAPLDLAGRKSEFMKRFGYEEFMYRLADGVADNVGLTMTDAGTAMDDVRWVVLPNFGRTVLEWEFLDPLGVPIERTLWDWGRHVGHLGPADQFAGVEHLLHSGAVEAGDRVLLVGIGVGFTWGSALLEWKEKTSL